MKTYFVHSWPEIAAYTETGSSGAQHRTGEGKAGCGSTITLLSAIVFR